MLTIKYTDGREVEYGPFFDLERVPWLNVGSVRGLEATVVVKEELTRWLHVYAEQHIMAPVPIHMLPDVVRTRLVGRTQPPALGPQYALARARRKPEVDFPADEADEWMNRLEELDARNLSRDEVFAGRALVLSLRAVRVDHSRLPPHARRGLCNGFELMVTKVTVKPRLIAPQGRLHFDFSGADALREAISDPRIKIEAKSSETMRIPDSLKVVWGRSLDASKLSKTSVGYAIAECEAQLRTYQQEAIRRFQGENPHLTESFKVRVLGKSFLDQRWSVVPPGRCATVSLNSVEAYNLHCLPLALCLRLRNPVRARWTPDDFRPDAQASILSSVTTTWLDELPLMDARTQRKWLEGDWATSPSWEHATGGQVQSVCVYAFPPRRIPDPLPTAQDVTDARNRLHSRRGELGLRALSDHFGTTSYIIPEKRRLAIQWMNAQ